MADFEIQIEGIEETCQMLTELPPNIVARGYLKALQAGARPIEQALDAREPVHEGKMKAARVTVIELDSQLRGGSVEIGYGKEGHKALWAEYGHRMVGHKPQKKDLGEVPAHPFMRPAVDVSAEAAIDAFAESLKETVEAEYQQSPVAA